VIRNRQVATAHGLPLVSYEGGQHLVAKPGDQHNDKAFVDFLKSVNRDPRMGELYTKLLDGWYKAGGKTFTFFNDTQPWSKWGSWGLKENYLDDDSVKYQAVQSYLNQFRAPPGGMGLNGFELWRSIFGSTTDLRADFNGDAVVDAADYIMLRERAVVLSTYTLWRETFGSTTDLRADLNSNGVVDTSDYILLRELLGPSNFALAPSVLQSGGPATVPEPNGRLLLLTAGAITLGFYLNERSPRHDCLRISDNISSSAREAVR
jgi:hypothetical protein